MVLGLLVGLITTVAPIVLVVWAVRRMSGRQGGRGSDARSVRRFFQYVLLYGLMIVAATGLADLVGLLFEGPALAGDDRSVLARALTFSVVGLPMFVAMALWSRRHLQRDPEEAESLGWAAYLTVAALTALLVAMTALHEVAGGALAGEGLDGAALVRFVVWTALWLAHWVASHRLLDAGRRQTHLLLGSLVGLGTSVAGLVLLLGAAVATLLLDQGGVLVDVGRRPLVEAAATVVVGVPVWVAYWLRGLSRAGRTPLWLGYVLPVGVGGSLALGVVGASITLYQVLVWLVGEPARTAASDHFRDAPTAAACVVVGAASWWYHRQVLGGGASGRTEVTRVYDYLIAGVALLAAAAGVTMVLVAAVESLVPPAAVERGGAVVNSLLAGLTLLAVGGPLWWLFWSRITRLVRAEGVVEVASPTRRIYLFVLFGLGGVAAVVAVLVAAFTGIEGALQDGLGAEVVRDMRVPVAILLTAGAISGYHWTVFREDRARTPQPEPVHGPRYILLIGAPDGVARDEIARRTGARVELWARADGLAPPWSVDDVVDAVGLSDAEALTVLAGPAGLEAIGMQRR